MIGWILEKFEEFLSKSSDVQETPLCDFSRLRFEVRPCDVILFEGKTLTTHPISILSSIPFWATKNLSIKNCRGTKQELYATMSPSAFYRTMQTETKIKNLKTRSGNNL